MESNNIIVLLKLCTCTYVLKNKNSILSKDFLNCQKKVGGANAEFSFLICWPIEKIKMLTYTPESVETQKQGPTCNGPHFRSIVKDLATELS